MDIATSTETIQENHIVSAESFGLTPSDLAASAGLAIRRIKVAALLDAMRDAVARSGRLTGENWQLRRDLNAALSVNADLLASRDLLRAEVASLKLDLACTVLSAGNCPTCAKADYYDRMGQ